MSNHGFKTLGFRTARLFAGLHERGVTVFNTSLAGNLMGITSTQASEILRAAVKRGLVTHVQRDLYNLIPFELGNVDFHLSDRYVLAATAMGDRPYFISHASAMDIHRVVTQPNFDVYISTTRRLTSRAIGGNFVRHVTLKQEQFFGFVTHDLGDGGRVMVSDLERTLIDGLRQPDYCMGIVEVGKAFSMAGRILNVDRLAEYARRMNRDIILRRLGFILETFGLTESGILADLQAGLPKVVAKLDPSLPSQGHYDKTWGLVFNVSREELLNAARH